MTLDQLRIFVAVAERLHMTQAARELNITQSAASAAVAALETRYSVPLFNRVGRHIELTSAGAMFLGEAKSVLARAAAAEQALYDLAGMKRGTLSIHASQTIANYWLPPFICQFRERYPNVRFRLDIGNTEQAVNAVLTGAADLGFIEGETSEPDLACSELAGDEMVLVVGMSHPWKGRAEVSPAELTETAWALREPGSGTRAIFEKTLTGFGLSISRLKLALELPSNEAIIAAVQAGAGATVISALAADFAIRAGILWRVGLELPQRPFHVLRHRQRYFSQAERAFFSLVGVGLV
jgi:DNA-binding transcriptional LysR family regulator